MRTITLEVPDDTIIMSMTAIRAIDKGMNKRQIQVINFLADDYIRQVKVDEEGNVIKSALGAEEGKNASQEV